MSNSAAILIPEQCSFCGIKNNIKFRCSQCKKTWYCTPEHQKLHWKEHKPICISMKQVYENKALQSMKTMSVGFSHHNYESNSLGLQEYDITPSPAFSGNPTTNVTARAEVLGQNLVNQGYCIIDQFLGETKGQKVLWDATKIVRSGIMKKGELVQADNKHTDEEIIRGDNIAWITGQEERYENMKLIINTMDQLIRHSRRFFVDNTIQGRTPAMVACYPGDGTGYKRHVDNMQKDGRCITCLYYLNKGWESQINGGQLRLFPLGKSECVDIEPIFDRLLVFWSDARSPHEVLPAFHERLAITLWYFDAVERNSVKDAYLTKLKHSFSQSTPITPSSSSRGSSNKNSNSTKFDNKRKDKPGDQTPDFKVSRTQTSDAEGKGSENS